MACLSHPAAAGVWRVHADGTGDAPSLEAAADSAASGDTLMIGPGRYEIELSITEKSLSLVGEGGASQVFLTRKPYQSVGQSAFIRVTATSPRFFRAEGIAFVDGHNHNHIWGGAIYLDGVRDIFIHQCAFSGNKTTATYSSFTAGGAIYVTEATSLEIENSEFRWNTSEGDLHGGGTGGAITAGAASIVIRRCIFDSNWAPGAYCAGYGGALSLGGSSILVEDCQFTGNHSKFGAAISASGALVVRGCEFRDNTAGNGTGQCFDSPGSIVRCHGSAEFLDDLFLHNRDDVAAVRLTGSGPVSIQRSTISFNGQSGGRFAALQIAVEAEAALQIQQSLVAFNSGPGISHSRTDLSGIGCNIIWANNPDFPAGIDFRGSNDNQASDPLYCDPQNAANTVAANSPCLPGGAGHPESCGVIGTVVAACNAVTVEPSTWSAIKARYVGSLPP